MSRRLTRSTFLRHFLQFFLLPLLAPADFLRQSFTDFKLCDPSFECVSSGFELNVLQQLFVLPKGMSEFLS